ncbi:hypothetical protein MMC13_007257 [Lambiella insularis]|nr:hypothetical protein [Lambiella insularis]
MPPDLTSSLFLHLNYSDVMALSAMNRKMSHSYILDSIIKSPFYSHRLGGKCQAKLPSDVLGTRDSHASMCLCEGSKTHSRHHCPKSYNICGNGPHNGHITQYCESHSIDSKHVLESGKRQSIGSLFEVCQKHRGKLSAQCTSTQSALLFQTHKDICEWVPVCERCTVNQILENPDGLNSCSCEKMVMAEEKLLQEGWNCGSCIFRTRNMNARTALKGFLEMMLDRAMPGATVQEMQAVLAKTSSKVPDGILEEWRCKYGIGESFTCPMCHNFCTGKGAIPLRGVPQVEMCLVCQGLFYAPPGSREMEERSKW